MVRRDGRAETGPASHAGQLPRRSRQVRGSRGEGGRGRRPPRLRAPLGHGPFDGRGLRVAVSTRESRGMGSAIAGPARLAVRAYDPPAVLHHESGEDAWERRQVARDRPHVEGRPAAADVRPDATTVPPRNVRELQAHVSTRRLRRRGCHVMADSSDIDNALVAKLGADATLLANMTNGVYLDEGPPGATRLVIVKVLA